MKFERDYLQKMYIFAPKIKHHYESQKLTKPHCHMKTESSEINIDKKEPCRHFRAVVVNHFVPTGIWFPYL